MLADMATQSRPARALFLAAARLGTTARLHHQAAKAKLFAPTPR